MVVRLDAHARADQLLALYGLAGSPVQCLNDAGVHPARDLITTGKSDPYRAGGDFETETAKHDAANGVPTR